MLSSKRFSLVALLVGLTMLAPLSNAKNKSPKADPKDEIEVVGHVSMAGGPIKRFVATSHYSSYYLYAEHASGENVTLIDVTNASQPAVLADVAYMPGGGTGSLAVVAGTAALVSSAPAIPAAAAPPQTIKIMDLSNPQNPKVAREFTGVTAMSKDDGRGLIFVANADGVWILKQHLALDPEVQRAYEDYVIYGSSMYPPRR